MPARSEQSAGQLTSHTIPSTIRDSGHEQVPPAARRSERASDIHGKLKVLRATMYESEENECGFTLLNISLRVDALQQGPESSLS